MIKANNVTSIENLPFQIIFYFIFLIEDPTRSTYQTRLNPSRLQIDRPNALSARQILRHHSLIK